MDVGQSLTPIFFGPLLDVGMFTAVLFGVAILQTFAILQRFASLLSQVRRRPKEAEA